MVVVFIVNEARRSLQDWVKTHIGEIDTAYWQYRTISTTDTKKTFGDDSRLSIKSEVVPSNCLQYRVLANDYLCEQLNLIFSSPIDVQS